MNNKDNRKFETQENPILRVSAKILFTPIILFGLYVQFHGDFGPGGGFQAGVIVASAFILYSLIFGLDKGQELLPTKFNFFLLALGAFLYGSVGLVTILMGEPYLSYNVLGSTKQSGQHIGILLVEFGVGLTVSNVMIALFNAFAGFDFKKIKK